MEQQEEINEDEEIRQDADPRLKKATADADFMMQCFDLALNALENAELDPLLGRNDKVSLQVEAGLTLFRSANRETSGPESILSLGVEYMSTLVQEKELDAKRSEELRAATFSGPYTFASGVGGGILSVHTCEHPGLKALYQYYAGTKMNLALKKVIEAMTIPGQIEDSQGFLLCPHCRVLVTVEMFQRGELWTEGAQAARMAARRREEERRG